MRRDLLQLALAKSRSIARRPIVGHTKGKIKYRNHEEISGFALKSQDQLQGLFGSSFSLAEQEQFNRLKDGIAEMKAIFMDTRNEILGLKKFLNFHQDVDGESAGNVLVEDEVDVEETPIESENNNELLKEDVDKKEAPIELVPRLIQGDVKEFTASPDQILQMLKTENWEANFWFHRVERKFTKAMEGFDMLYAAPSLQPLKLASVKNILIELSSKIKIFESDLLNNPSKCFLNDLEKENAKLLKTGNEEAMSMICELEDTVLLAMEDVGNLIKRSKYNGHEMVYRTCQDVHDLLRIAWGAENEVEMHIMNFDRLKEQVSNILLGLESRGTNSWSKIAKFKRQLSLLQSQLMGIDCMIVRALKVIGISELNIAKNCINRSSTNYNYATMLTRARGKVDKLDADINKLKTAIEDYMLITKSA